MWQFRDADWDALNDTFAETDWSFIDCLDTSAAADHLSNIILEQMREHILSKEIEEKKTSHPWLTDRAVEAVRVKHSLRGSEQERAANVECSKILMEEYNGYVHRTRRKLQELPRGSKQWWTLSRQLMQKKMSSKSRIKKKMLI